MQRGRRLVLRHSHIEVELLPFLIHGLSRATIPRAMATAQILYTSAAIHKAVKRLFSNPPRNDRRVALVAYVGADALSLLPHPKGIRVVCAPQPLATSHVALQELRRRGATVEIA